MDFVEYKCPCCAAALTFSPKTQKLFCKSCENEYDLATLQLYEESTSNEPEPNINWEYQTGAEPAERTEDGLYICPSCGAEIEADETKVSTTCPYCDNVVVIKATADGNLKPDAMIPFKVTADHAQQMLEDFCKGKRLLPKNFKNKSYLKNLKGYYVPYWLFDCDAQADMTFDATKTRMWHDSKYDYVDTSYFLVKRKGEMSFFHVPVDGSTKMDDATTESIEPFNYKELTDFNPAYLAGYETDKYDVKSEDAEPRAKERLYNSAEALLTQTVERYETVTTRKRDLSTSKATVKYTLLPVWLFETVYEGKNYQFAINGQTGKMVGELPVDKGAFRRYLIQFTAIGTVVLSIIGSLLFGGVL